jgi:hypothetical protein
MGRKRTRPIAKPDKVGRNFYLDKYENCNIGIYVPNFTRYLTAQLRITCWVTLTEGTGEYELSHNVSKVKKRIRDFVRDWKNPLFRRECIVSFKTGDGDHSSGDYQYLMIDIVLYTNEDSIFDRVTLHKLVEPFAHMLIDEYIPNQEAFFITHNPNRDKKRLKEL